MLLMVLEYTGIAVFHAKAAARLRYIGDLAVVDRAGANVVRVDGPKARDGERAQAHAKRVDSDGDDASPGGRRCLARGVEPRAI